MQFKNSKGFTLIEMAIVVMIIGMAFATIAQVMMQREKWVRADETKSHVASAADIISRYRNTYGRYPCPASLTAVRGDVNYGRETDCSDISEPIGGGINPDGVAIVAGQRSVDYTNRNTDTPVSGVPRVRIGALPFRTLNLEEDEAYDGYNDRIVYALTEQLGVEETFEGDDGAIAVLNDSNVTIIDPPSSSHFVVLSPGENGVGAFSRSGVRRPCINTTQEAENCNFIADAIFRFAQTGISMDDSSASTFDDVMAYATHDGVPLWERPDEGGETGDNINVKTSGGIGIGPNASKDPNQELQVEGSIRAQDDPATPDVVEGNIEANSICEYDDDPSKCFPSNLIAGNAATGGGLHCPAGYFMIGIKNNAAICEDNIRIECPAGKFVLGINADGTLNCGLPPPKSCATENRPMCGAETKTLFASAHNTTKTLVSTAYPANPLTKKYKCNDGTWQLTSTTGLCSCTESTTNQAWVSCAEPASACGNRFNGLKLVADQLSCPSGVTSQVVLNNSACNCLATSKDTYSACPAGFNAGQRKYTNTNICGATPACSGPVEILEHDDKCRCEVRYEERDLPCPGGHTGTYREERDWLCPGGSTNPGAWTAWREKAGMGIAERCSCVETETITPRSCPPGQQGQITVQINFHCPPLPDPAYTTEQEVSNTCEPMPPAHCEWKMVGDSPSESPAPLPLKEGEECVCGTPSGTCSRALGGGRYEVSACICGET